MPENLINPVQPTEPAVEDIFSAVEKNTKPAPLPQPAIPREDITVMPEAPKRMSKMTWVLIILGVVAVVLIALSGYLFWKKNRTDQTNNKNSSVLEDQGLVKPVNANKNINANNNSNINTTVIAPPPTFVDSDHDGLSDEAEEKYGTNPKKIDSDDDGLSDREEVKVYLTDPNNEDTDGDGYLDGGEVKNGYNPNGEGKLFD